MSDDPPSPTGHPARAAPHAGAAPLQIDVQHQAGAWTEALGEPEAIVRRAAAAAWAALPTCADTPRDAPWTQPAELALVLADDAAVRALNRAYRGRDAATNVLSFANLDAGEPAAAEPDAPLPLGDVVLALETLRREAGAQGKTLAAHLSHLVVHGVLHLLGWDHQADAEAEAMEDLERRVLAGLGIADPYAEPPETEAEPPEAGAEPPEAGAEPPHAPGAARSARAIGGAA